MNLKLIGIIFLFIPLIGFSQNEREYRKALRQAELHFEAKEYAKAIPYLEKIKYAQHGAYISDAEFNFMIAACYWNVDSVKIKAIPHLERYLQQSHEETEAEWWLAELYILNNEFDKALEKLRAYIEYVEQDPRLTPAKREKEIIETKREIVSCQYAKQMVSHPVKAEVLNLGDSINTEFAEYAPVVDNHEKHLYFTRKSPDNINKKKDKNGEYFEEIFYSSIRQFYYDADGKPYTGTETNGKKVKLRFSPARNVGKPVNQLLHDAAIQLSHNDDHLFILRNNHVWKTVRVDDQYTEPIKFAGLEGLINAGAYIPSLSINKTEDLIYFSCDKPGGYGGLDLYYTKKVNDVWQEPVNMGERINTEYDEDAPYIDPDGHTFYFSSKGHSSMGGYDIFKSYLSDEGWTYPHNLGYPINSSADDIFFTMPEKENRGYFSSNRPGGKGKMDLYEVTFENKRDQLAEIRGTILVGEMQTPGSASLTVIDEEEDQELARYQSDVETGDYHLLMHHNDKYKVRVEVSGFAPFIQSFDIPEKLEKFVFFNELQLSFVLTEDQIAIGQQLLYLVPFQVHPDSAEVYKPVTKEVFFFVQPDSLIKIYNTEKKFIDGLSNDFKFLFPELKSEKKKTEMQYFDEIEKIDISQLTFEEKKGYLNKAEFLEQFQKWKNARASAVENNSKTPGTTKSAPKPAKSASKKK